MKLKIFEFQSATSCHCLEGADVGVDGNKQDAAVAAGYVKKNKKNFKRSTGSSQHSWLFAKISLNP